MTEDLVSILRALADPTRHRLLNLLSCNTELCVCDLQRIIGSRQPNISRHLAYLENSGWVQHRRECTRSFYSLRRDLGVTAGGILTVLQAEWSQSEPFRNECLRLELLIKDGSCRSLPQGEKSERAREDVHD